MVFIIFEPGKIYDVNGFGSFVKVRPYTGAIGSGEGFCFITGKMRSFQRLSVMNLSEKLCDLFVKTGKSSGIGGFGVHLEEWFRIQEHTQSERFNYRLWKNYLDVVLTQRLRVCNGCRYEFLGTLGLRRRLDLLSLAAGICTVVFVDTSCFFEVVDGYFDEYLSRRRMFWGISSEEPLSSEVRSWLAESENELAILSASSGSCSDVLFGRMFDLMSFGVSKFGLYMVLVTDKDVDYFKKGYGSYGPS